MITIVDGLTQPATTQRSSRSRGAAPRWSFAVVARCSSTANYGDSDGCRAVGDVIALALIVQALERLIMKKKLRARQALPPKEPEPHAAPVAEIQRRRRY